MNELFKRIAEQLGLEFGSGTQNELEDLVKDITDPQRVCLFYEPYDRMSMDVNPRVGKLTRYYPFRVWLLVYSFIDEAVEDRLPKVEGTIDIAEQILIKLSEDVAIRMDVDPVLSETSNIMCGVLCTGTFTGNPKSICN